MFSKSLFRQSRRRILYRRVKRYLRRALSQRWPGSRAALNRVLVRALRNRTRAELLTIARKPALAALLVIAVLAPAAAPADPIELAEVAADSDSSGFGIFGVTHFSLAGISVAGAGDVNGDGVDDVIIGSYRMDSILGSAFVVFGKNDGDKVLLADVQAGSGGFHIQSATVGDHAGLRVAAAGDVNDDGLADLLVTARNAAPNGSGSGACYVVFGKEDTETVNLADVESGTGGFAIHGAATNDTLTACAGIGDMNGDGLDDVLVGAPGESTGGLQAGAAYVVFGKKDGGAVDLASVALDTNAGGFAIFGAVASDRAGESVAGAGDVDGDGLVDVIVGAPGDFQDDTAHGTAYVVFGKTTGTSVSLAAVESDVNSQGFAIHGEAAGDRAGESVAGAGDINGDGRHDLLIGAPDRLDNGDGSGKCYVLFGKEDGEGVALAGIAANDNAGGFAILGRVGSAHAGASVAGLQDISGDGRPEILVGAPGDATNGAAFVVFGKSDGASIDLNDLEAAGSSAGFVMLGAAPGDGAGAAVHDAGDLNGDGLADILVGAPFVDFTGNTAGAAYVVFASAGSDVTWVDFAHAGAEDGSSDFPYNTLAEAVAAVPPGGTVRIKGDTAVHTSPETLAVTKPVTLESVGGRVRIGAP